MNREEGKLLCWCSFYFVVWHSYAKKVYPRVPFYVIWNPFVEPQKYMRNYKNYLLLCSIFLKANGTYQVETCDEDDEIALTEPSTCNCDILCLKTLSEMQ